MANILPTELQVPQNEITMNNFDYNYDVLCVSLSNIVALLTGFIL